MRIGKILISVVSVLLGVFMFIYGGYDDSPGAQGLGLVLFITGVLANIKSHDKSRKNT